MRVGLVGWGTPTGLGYLHYDLWDLGLVQHWLVPQHPKLGIDDTLVPSAALRCARSGEPRLYREFLSEIDVLLICERPVLEHFDLVGEAQLRKIPVCCIPNMEWLPDPRKARWVTQVNLMWAPTRWSAELLRLRAKAALRNGVVCAWQKAIYGGRWGVNLRRFPFTQRLRARRLLFANGFGGAGLRKGLAAVVAAAERCRVPLVVHSQTRELPRLPEHCEVRLGSLPHPADVFALGDVLVAPSRWEGIGLQLYEAQACGLPLLTTAGPPMQEALPPDGYPPLACQLSSHRLRTGPVTAYEVDPEALAGRLEEIYQSDIAEASLTARHYMETNYDLRETIRQLRDVLARRKR